jgi:hypothetical protein
MTFLASPKSASNHLSAEAKSDANWISKREAHLPGRSMPRALEKV